MNIQSTSYSYNTNFYGLKENINYLRNKRTQKVIMNAFEMYRDSFNPECQNGLKKTFNIWEKTFKKKTIKYFDKFRQSQPFLPTTKFPKASVIKQNIKINPDGSTNIKGVYVDSDGLVILDYNNIENWEIIGFPKNTVSKGIKISDERLLTDKKTDMDIGNIRFFAHGMYPNERNIEGYEACSKKGAKGFLSFNYGCRSDIKSFFFPIGIISDIAPQNIVGGQNSWKSYSMLEHGFKKNIPQHIQHSYIETQEGFAQRNLLADLTRNSTGLQGEDYIKFVHNQANKPIQEIESDSQQKKIIKAFANFNSYIGGYRYDEIYGLEPIPMGIFIDAKEISHSFDNISKLVKKALSTMPVTNNNAGTSMPEGVNALRKFAIDKDIPCLVFNYK